MSKIKTTYPENLEKAAQFWKEQQSKFPELNNWDFKFDNAKIRFGVCRYSKKEITVSLLLSVSNEWKHVEDVILHEIAHVLAGTGNGHNWVWKNKCREIGAKPERYYNSEEVIPIQGKYVYECPQCNEVSSYHRKLKVSSSCGKCYPRDYNPTYKLQRKKENK